MMKRTQIISFEGIIGAGKTTTIDYITKELQKKGFIVHVVKENVDEWVKDGILQKFYEDTKRYAYHFQTKAFSDKVKNFYDVFMSYFGKVDYIITERSLISDYIFASLLYSDGFLDDMEFKHYNEWYNLWTVFVPQEFRNCITVYLKINSELAINRIKERKRDGEDKISVEYETKLNNLHEKYFNNSQIIWDSTKNIHESENILELTNLILKFI